VQFEITAKSQEVRKKL